MYIQNRAGQLDQHREPHFMTRQLATAMKVLAMNYGLYENL